MGGRPIDYFSRIVPQYDRHSHASRRNAGQHAARYATSPVKLAPPKPSGTADAADTSNFGLSAACFEML